MSGIPPSMLALLPNPLTPMALIPPDIARQLTISYYIAVAALVIMLWDMLNTILVDYKLIKQGLSIPLAAYFLSRFSMLAFLLSVTLLNTAPLGNCHEVSSRIVWLYPLQMSCTALLFFFRVRAMYHDTKWATPFFFVMWLGVTAASTTEAFHNTNTNLGPTAYCIGKVLPKYAIVASILPFVNDTLIFVAITMRLAGSPDTSYAPRRGSWIRVVLFGEYLPHFSKAMLRDGQAYYLSVVVVYLLFLILFHVNSVPVLIRWSIGIPSVTVVNIMTCRVYRNTKSGLYRESTDAVSLPTLQVARPPGKSGESAYPSIIMMRSHNTSSMDGSRGTNTQTGSDSEKPDKTTEIV